jgi:predicted RNA binding protein YcfA (HicA-like mRNA interferase family)
MKSISGKDFAKILERHGWALLRVQGSHHIYGKTGTDVRISVPIHKNQSLIHKNQSLKTGLLHHFLKVAGLTDKDL